MDWIALLISGLIFPSIWWFARKHNQLKANELCHIEKAIMQVREDVKETRESVKDLTAKFIDHLEDHPQ